jgi:ATP-dependent protease HslVU (ClpYQ) peptidase subunit
MTLIERARKRLDVDHDLAGALRDVLTVLERLEQHAGNHRHNVVRAGGFSDYANYPDLSIIDETP